MLSRTRHRIPDDCRLDMIAGTSRLHLPAQELGVGGILQGRRGRRPAVQRWMMGRLLRLRLLLLLLPERAKARRAHELCAQRLHRLLRQLERHPIGDQRSAWKRRAQGYDQRVPGAGAAASWLARLLLRLEQAICAIVADSMAGSWSHMV